MHQHDVLPPAEVLNAPGPSPAACSAPAAAAAGASAASVFCFLTTGASPGEATSSLSKARLCVCAASSAILKTGVTICLPLSIAQRQRWTQATVSYAFSKLTVCDQAHMPRRRLVATAPACYLGGLTGSTVL
jgi:hypothetical protein